MGHPSPPQAEAKRSEAEVDERVNNPCKNKSANSVAISPADSGPSFRYHVIVQFITPKTARAAIDGEAHANTPSSIPS